MQSPATEVLYHEHEIILLARAQTLALLNETDISQTQEQLLWYLNFYREYGDRYHHHKEEETLFATLGDKNPMLAQGIIASLTDHHAEFRELLTEIEAAIHKENWDSVKTDFTTYLANLRDHISAEDDEFFVTADMELSEKELDDLFYTFQDKDHELGLARKAELEQIILSRQ